MKNSYIALILAVLVIALGYFGSGLLSRYRQQVSLETQIGDIAGILAQVPAPAGDAAKLERQLADALADLKAERAAFPPPQKTTQIIDLIFQQAAAHDVSAIPLMTQDWRQESRDGRDYHVFRISVEAAGTYAALLDFIAALERSSLTTMAIEDVNISVDGVSSGDDTPVTAGLRLAVYAGPPTN